MDEDTMIAMAHENAGDDVELNSDGNAMALDDVDVGYLENPSDPSETMTFFDPRLLIRCASRSVARPSRTARCRSSSRS